MPDPSLVVIQAHAAAIWAAVQRPRLDDVSASALNPEILAAAEKQPGQPVVLDLSAVSYVPSLGLGSLVSLQRTFRQQGRRLILVGLHDDVRSTFAVTRLDKLFEIQPTFEAAVARVQGESR